MRAAILFVLVAGIPQVGVAVTLADPALDHPGATHVVYLAGGTWCCLGWLAAKRWETDTRAGVWRWFKWVYVVPLMACFGLALANDPTAADGFRRLASPADNSAAPSTGMLDSLQPAASPVRNGPSAAESIDLLRLVRDRFVRFVLQLLVCVPVPWWAAAVLLAVWKGKR